MPIIILKTTTTTTTIRLRKKKHISKYHLCGPHTNVIMKIGVCSFHNLNPSYQLQFFPYQIESSLGNLWRFNVILFTSHGIILYFKPAKVSDCSVYWHIFSGFVIFW